MAIALVTSKRNGEHRGRIQLYIPVAQRPDSLVGQPVGQVRTMHVVLRRSALWFRRKPQLGRPSAACGVAKTTLSPGYLRGYKSKARRLNLSGS